MSLIQEALRRAQKERGGASAPVPPAVRAPAAKGAVSRPLIVAAACLAVLVAAGFILHIARRAIPFGQGAPAPPAAARTSAPVAALPSAPVARPPAPPAASSAAPAQVAPAKDGGRRSSAAVTALSLPTAIPAGLGRPAAPPPAADGGNPPVRQQPPAAPSGPPGDRGALLARYNEGIAFQEKGDWESAGRSFRESVAADPSLVEGWNGLGTALMRLGKKGEAEAAFARALSADPGYYAAVMNVGLLRLEEGRTREAAELFSRAAGLSPRNPAPRVNLAIALGRLGRLPEAEETLLSARSAFPSNPLVLYHLGTLYERKGDRGRAKEAYASFLDVSDGRRPDLERGVRGRLAEWSRGKEKGAPPSPTLP